MKGDVTLAISYKKLWKILIDRDMNKTELRKLAGVSPATIAKLSKGENLHTDTLLKISTALGCSISDIMESEITNE